MPFEIVAPEGGAPPPFIEVAGIANFRDIGGYATTTTTTTTPTSVNNESSSNEVKSIRRGLVFRCADPSRIEPAGLAKLRDLGVARVFDLRSNIEVQRQGPEWEGVPVDHGPFVTRVSGGGGTGDEKVESEITEGRKIERVFCPVFADQDYGPEKVALRFSRYAQSGSEGFVQAYSDILASGAAAYNTVLTHLASEDPTPCVVHCTAGKDRTGIIVALLYLLCGVPVDVVAREYSLTDEGLKHLKPLYMERLLKHAALAGNEEGVANMISSRPENMAATINMINQRYGGAERYILEVVGLSREQVARLKKNLTVRDAPIFPA